MKSMRPFFKNSRSGSGKDRQRLLKFPGFVLVEAMMSLSILIVIGLLLFKLALNILAPRQWVMMQTITDAYMTSERALAEGYSFSEIVGPDSLWPDFAGAAGNRSIRTPNLAIGRLPANPANPDGTAIMGQVTRTRFADIGNYPVDGGAGTIETNPAAMKVWKLQSVLVYEVGGKSYAKSRTVIRAQ